MKSKGYIIVFAVLALLLTNVFSSEISIQNVKGDPQVTVSDEPAPGSTVDDWSMYRHDIQRTGTSISPVSNGSLHWRFYAGDKIRSSPAVANGVVYQGANDGYVYALNASTGSVIWQYAASPAVSGNIIYVVARSGLYAFNATSGLEV